MILGGVAATFAPSLASAGSTNFGRAKALKAALQRPGTLAYWAARSSMLFGSFGWHYLVGADYSDSLSHECSMIYPAYMGTEATRKVQSGFDFSAADQAVKFAEDNNLAIGGGYLVVHGSEPPWITPATPRATALAELRLDVSTTMTRYAGRCDHWIVANEVISLRDKRPYGLRDCTWLSAIGGDPSAGTDYVSQAFVAARKADPEAVLILNEFGIEGPRPEDQRKRDALLTLLQTFRHNGTPIDGVGIQGHLWGDQPIDASALRSFFDSLHGLGLKIMITELDVIDVSFPADIRLRDLAVAQTVGAFLKVALSNPSVNSINVWGLSDDHSWYNSKWTPRGYRRTDGLPSRGALLDDDLHRKPAYFTVLGALKDLIPEAH